MKKFALLLLSAICCLLSVSSVHARDEIPITFTRPQNAPYLVGQPEFNIDAEEFGTISLKINSDHSGPARLFWATSLDPQINEQKSISFSLTQGRHDYIFNLKARNQYWLGFVGQLVLFPEGGVSNLKIESAKACLGNFWTNSQAGWQEFFAFEAPQLRTVNFIYGPKINGTSVNLYLYGLILLSALWLLAYFYFRPKKKRLTWPAWSYRVVLICLVFWFSLDLRQLVDQARIIRLDFQSFWGQDLESKRRTVAFGDFYDFVRFASTQLPPGSTYTLLHQPAYYFQERAQYFLYPCKHSQQGQFLLVYDPAGTLGPRIKELTSQGYRLLTSYKKGAAIYRQ